MTLFNFDRKCMNPDAYFHARIVNNVSSCISPRSSDHSSAIHSISLHANNNWNNWLAWKFLFISFSIWLNVAGQNDRQGQRLTGQLPCQSEHCLLTGCYFKPCTRPLISPFSFLIKSFATFNNEDYNLFLILFVMPLWDMLPETYCMNIFFQC